MPPGVNIRRPQFNRDAYGLGHEEHPENSAGGTYYKGHISMGLFLHLLPRRGSEVDGLHFFIVSPLTRPITPKTEMYAYAYRLKNVRKSAADVKLTVQQQKECVVRVTPALRTSYFANSNFSARRMRDDLERDCPINHTYLT